MHCVELYSAQACNLYIPSDLVILMLDVMVVTVGVATKPSAMGNCGHVCLCQLVYF
jgi:hypothetical protein